MSDEAASCIRRGVCGKVEVWTKGARAAIWEIERGMHFLSILLFLDNYHNLYWDLYSRASTVADPVASMSACLARSIQI